MGLWPLLDQASEDALHAARLLSFETKLYKQIARRLFADESHLALNNHVTPRYTEDKEHDPESPDLETIRWRNDTLLEVIAMESSLTRTQFLYKSNERERERYASEKQRIIDTAQNVRDNNAQLHAQLAEEKDALAVRKSYDAVAAEIAERKTPLKARDETHAAIEKLRNEIAELEREGTDYVDTWAERREQFGKIVDEGMNMLRLIRDEKEEAERQEGMDGVDEPGSPRPASRGSTPKPGEDGAAPKSETTKGQSSLRVENGVSSPSPKNETTENEDGMQVDSVDDAADALEEGEAEDSPAMDGKMELG